MEFKIDGRAEFILNSLMDNGYKAYIVGGSVRDTLMGKGEKVHDWDICTSAHPEDVIRIFREGKQLKVIENGIKHGTVTVVFGEKKNCINGYEITTFRLPGEDINSIKFTSDINKDLGRRDFTINAMAYNHIEGLIWVGKGIDDIENKIIRCVGKPHDRFKEDPLRILRAMRFKSKLGYKIETNTSKAMIELKGNLCDVSKQRKATELMKIMLGKYKVDVLDEYRDIIFEIIPELRILDTINDTNGYTVYTNTIKILSRLNKCCDVRILLAALFRNTDSEGVMGEYRDVASVLTDIGFSNNMGKEISQLVEYSKVDCLTEADIKRLLNSIGEKQLRKVLILKKADIDDLRYKYLGDIENKLDKIIIEKQAYRLNDLVVGVKDLIALGYKNSIQIRNILSLLLEQVIENKVRNNKEELVAEATRLRRQLI